MGLLPRSSVVCSASLESGGPFDILSLEKALLRHNFFLCFISMIHFLYELLY